MGQVGSTAPSTATTTLRYDPAHPGDVIAKTDATGHVSTFAYDQYGDLVRASDPLSETATYSYDRIGRLTSLVSPRGNVAGANPLSYTTSITADALGATTAITDPVGHATTYQYHANGNLVAATDALTHTTRYGYDAADEQTTITQTDGTVRRTGYDAAGNAITQTDPLTHTTRYSYDPLNRLSSVTDPLTRTTVYTYDLAGNLAAVSDPLSHTTSYGYDAANERTTLSRTVSPGLDAVWRTEYDAAGRVSSTTDPLTHTTRYAYDSLGRLLSVTDPLTRSTRYSYDLGGNRLAVTDALSRTTAATYDRANALTLVMRPDGSLTRRAHDAAGNLSGQTDPLDHATASVYDVLDRLTSVTDPLTHTTRYGYDAVGNQLTVTDPLTHTTSYAYDALNRLVSVTDPLTHTTRYGYDLASEPISVTQPDGSVRRTGYDLAGRVITQTDPLTRSTRYGYDALDRVITATDPLTRTTVYTYDLAGNRTALTDALSRTTAYRYNADDELTGRTYALSSTPGVTYTYTAAGQRASMADGTGTSAYSYDLRDRVITSTNGAGQRLGYGYDGAGRLTRLTYPDSSVVTRTYDAADRLTGVSDWLGHSTSFAYAAADNVITQTYPNTTTAAFSYNAANQLTGLVDKQGGSTLWSYSYGRDALGQLSSSADPLDGQTHTYGYSPLSQLTSDQKSGAGTTSWTPDGASQVTQRVDPTGPATSTLSYDAASELGSLRTVSGTTTTRNLTLSYNADGDRTAQSDSVSGASSSYGYDQEDRPITATTGLTQASYAYDGDGLRQSKTVSGTTTQQTWDTAAGLPQLVQDGTTRYVPGPDGSPLEQIAADGTVLYYYQDQLGSTRGLLNGAGQTVATYTYDPYGQPTASTGSVRTPFGFAGQYTDAETGLQYLRARSYDPATMQFLSADPLVDQTGQPYAYTAADPLNATDPSGLCDNVHSVSVFGQTYSVRYHVPLTSQSHILCSEAAKLKVRDVVVGVNTRLTGFTNSDFSNAVTGDVQGLVHGVRELATAGAACVQDTQACAQATAQLATYIATHQREVLDALVQAQVAQAEEIGQEIACGQYGAAAGHLLVAFVVYRGGGKLTGVFKKALSGILRGTAEETAAEEAAAAERAAREPDPVSCTGCFPAGTRVATPQGLQPIQTLHVGDTVLAEDPTTHKVEAEPVQAVVHDPAAPLMAITLSDGSTITATLTHAFWVDAGDGLRHAGWFYAEHLHVGDQLRTANGAHVVVVGLRYNVGRADVYTLTVVHDHTFFVGVAQVLVHNANPACERISLAIIHYANRYGHLTGGQINALIGAKQRELLREFLGQSLAGARERLGNFYLPPDLTNDTLLKYAVVARREVLRPANSAAFQVQDARLRLIIRALTQRGG